MYIYIYIFEIYLHIVFCGYDNALYWWLRPTTVLPTKGLEPDHCFNFTVPPRVPYVPVGSWVQVVRKVQSVVNRPNATFNLEGGLQRLGAWCHISSESIRSCKFGTCLWVTSGREWHLGFWTRNSGRWWVMWVVTATLKNMCQVWTNRPLNIREFTKTLMYFDCLEKMWVELWRAYF